MMKFGTVALLATSLFVTACGTTDSERGLSGAGIGAGVGAAGAAVLGAPIVGGALLGGAVGGATGILTDKDDINLDNLN